MSKFFFSTLKLSGLICLFLITSSFAPSEKEEGMFPLAQLSGLDLQKAGLKIPQTDIYNPGKVGLTNALVRLGGCTGSFISDEGLIITNHHCVYGSVASLSTPESNYLENGFYAASKDAELKTGLPCRITLSFDDVSNRVLEGVANETTSAGKKNRINQNIDKIEKEERALHPELEIEISEMFVGRFYTLFRYKLLSDVRLVYVPPKAIGKFGGEADNWVWPRHNGDFSVVRAYENGKPYKPEKHLKIKATGTNENDFVFILGYPGTTYRHAPAEFLTYQYKHILPVISWWYDQRIALLENDAKGNEAKKLRYAGTLASLHNTSKNFKGKMQGLTRTDIIETRYNEQTEMEGFLAKNPELNKKYGQVLPSINKLYNRRMEIADDFILLNQMTGSSGAFCAAEFVATGKARMAGMSKSESSAWLNDNKQKIAEALKSEYRIFTPELDRKMFSKLLYRVYKNGNGRVDEVMKMLKLTNPTWQVLDLALVPVWEKSNFLDVNETLADFDKSPESFFKRKNKLIDIASIIAPVTELLSAEWRQIIVETDALMPPLAELREAYFGGTFVPDANATLRFTYGYVRGYSPADGIYTEPYTTLNGIIEKVNGASDSNDPNADYYMPSHLLDKFKTIEPSDKLVNPKNNQVVVGVLYNLDTTGGNSGSPILDAYGNLVGVNFDRAFSATINDFEWNEAYSRSIGVDIRYVLYVMKYMSNANELLAELQVEL